VAQKQEHQAAPASSEVKPEAGISEDEE